MSRSHPSLDPVTIVGFLLVLVIGISMVSTPAAAEDGAESAPAGGGSPDSATPVSSRNRPQPTRAAPAGAGGVATTTQTLLPYSAEAGARLFGNGLHGDGYWPGRDYLAPCGTPLYNPLPGETTVEDVGVDSYCGPNGCGNTYVRLNNGQYRYVLMHGDYVVKPGARLTQGQLIGHEASNGNSSACHSHVSVRTSTGQLLDVARLN